MLNSTGHITGSTSSTNNNNLNDLASSIPLPPGSPPSTPMYEEMQHQNQNQNQQQNQHQPQHQHQQQQPQLNPMQSHHQTPLQFYRPQSFGSLNQPMTFSGLAKRAEDVVGETLSQYGPGMVGSAIPTIGQNNLSAYPSMMPRMPMNQPAPRVQPQQYNQYNISMANSHLSTNQPPVYNIAPTIHSMQMASRPSSSHIPGFPLPASSGATFTHSNPIVINRPNTNVNVINQMGTSNTSNSNILCNPSPPRPTAPVSPPLDALKSQQDVLVSSTSQQKEPENSFDIVQFNMLEDVKKRCANMVMNQVLEEHRSLKHLLEEAQRRRQTLETEIYDLRRSLPGHGSLETHPAFIRKKDQEKKCDAKCKDLNDAIKYVTGVLYTKYQHTVPVSDIHQPLQGPKRNAPTRAKMSTAAPSPRVVKDRPEDERSLLDLEDGNLWCKYCDLHFKTLKEFCEHMHKREHQNQVGLLPRPPWRETTAAPARLDKPKTFAKLKSLCSSVGNKLRLPFKVQDIDEVMYPSSRNRERMKMVNLDRDRGRIDKSDLLFCLKGFDHLVPVSGFYCKLCHTTMCDINEVEEHFRTYSHNYEHAKFVALSGASERKFRADLEKSLSSQREESTKESPSKNKASAHKSKEPSVSRPQSSHSSVTTSSRSSSLTNDVSQYSARLPYKKPTSRIVDDHEVIADKFDKRNDQRREVSHRDEKKRDEQRRDDRKRDDNRRDPVAETLRTFSSSHSSTKPSSSNASQLKRKLPEIVPVKKSSSGALKRLRHDDSKTNDAHEPESDPISEEKAMETTEEQLPIEKTTQKDKGKDKEKHAETLTSSDEEDELATQPYMTTSDLIGDDEDSVKMVSRGDPDSPFPELDLTVTGHTHKDALKSKQLFQRSKVKLNRIKLDDYKHLMLPSTELWNRVTFLMTKKEPEKPEKEANSETHLTQRTFVKTSGENVPVDIDDSSNEDKGDFEWSRLKDFFCDK